MNSRPDMRSKALSIAVLLCVPLIIRCGSDSDGGGTSGAAGAEGGAGNGGLAHGGHAGSGHAGSGHAGSAGESTSGGTNAAGTAGDVSAGTGGVSAGTGGVSAGTGGVSAGTGGMSSAGAGGASAGAGGASAGAGGASAGTGGASAGTGGVSAGGGAAGAGPGILNVSIDSLYMIGQCMSLPETFTISNTGQSALTWTAAVSAPQFVAVAPSSSTLLPGTEITVTLSSGMPVPLNVGASVVITITSDVAAQPPAIIPISYAVSGTWIGVQPDIDVGEVPLGQSKTVSVPTPAQMVELALGSGNSAFSVPNMLAHGADHWTMIFTPSVLGPQSSDLSIIVPFGTMGPACPSPNHFTARGVGIAP
jgi:hypothetical protein